MSSTRFQNSDEGDEQKALLVSLYANVKDKILCGEHLDELELLAETLGYTTVEKVGCYVRKFDPATQVGSGKLEELVEKAHKSDVDIIIFDDEISSSQQRNLEKAFERAVIDRTELILAVFAERAQTKEARLQIDLAKLAYEAPRLKRLWTHLSRQAGTAGGSGGGYLKGEGEKQIEIDRRIIKQKIDKLKKELEEVRKYRQTQRQRRKKLQTPSFAIVGYTNAGKSTLLNAMTGAGVSVEDKLFATLDTTTRQMTLPNNQEVVVIDTVGFIRKLPHQLVAAFKSTLEEALFADILLHVVDASHPESVDQAKITVEVLEELGAKDIPIITLLNKIDKEEGKSLLQRVQIAFPKTVEISALQKRGFEELYATMVEELKKIRKVVKFRIPQADYAQVSELMRLGNVLTQDFEENDVILVVDSPTSVANRYRKYWVE